MRRKGNTLVPARMPEKEKISKHEDVALKVSAEFFRDEIMPVLNIQGKVVACLAAEGIVMDLRKGFQDFNFLMEDDSIKHFEFQSTNEGLIGLKRFRMYEAVISYENKKEVTTYVMFSGNIKRPMTEFTEGINTYKVEPIILSDKDAAYDITRRVTGVDEEVIKKVEAVIYIMADKFLESSEMKKLREEIKMTRLGQMLYSDWKEEGREEGERLHLLMLVQKKLKKGKTLEMIADEVESDLETITVLVREISEK